MDGRIVAACQEFEGLMLRPLFADLKFGFTLPVSDDDQDNAAADECAGGAVMQALFSETLARAFARAGGVGLTHTLMRALEAHRS